MSCFLFGSNYFHFIDEQTAFSVLNKIDDSLSLEKLKVSEIKSDTSESDIEEILKPSFLQRPRSFYVFNEGSPI